MTVDWAIRDDVISEVVLVRNEVISLKSKYS